MQKGTCAEPVFSWSGVVALDTLLMQSKESNSRFGIPLTPPPKFANHARIFHKRAFPCTKGTGTAEINSAQIRQNRDVYKIVPCWEGSMWETVEILARVSWQ